LIALPPDPMAIVIRDSVGWRDDLVWGVSAVEYWREHGYHIVVDGRCGSICTLVFRMPTDRLCVTPRAVFEFHMGSDTLTRDVMWAAYPQGLKTRLGALTVDVVTVRWPETARFARECG
jgi:hypothetical protein